MLPSSKVFEKNIFEVKSTISDSVLYNANVSLTLYFIRGSNNNFSMSCSVSMLSEGEIHTRVPFLNEEKNLSKVKHYQRVGNQKRKRKSD